MAEDPDSAPYIDRENIYGYGTQTECDEIEEAEIEAQDARNAANPFMWIGGKDGPRVPRNVGRFDDEALAEKELENAIAAELRRAGHVVEQQVNVGTGIADIVIEDAVIEVKLLLTRSAIHSAIGQVTLYAAALGKPRRIIAGYFVAGTSELLESVKSAGFEVDAW